MLSFEPNDKGKKKPKKKKNYVPKAKRNLAKKVREQGGDVIDPELEALQYEYGEATQTFTIHENDPDLKPITFDVDYIIRKNYYFGIPTPKTSLKLPHPIRRK